MLIRISLIAAILFALAVGTLNVVMVKDKITTLKDQRDSEKSQKEQAQKDRDKNKADLDKTTKTLKQTKADLDVAKVEREKAVAEAAAQVKRANELSTNLDKVTLELKSKSADLQAFVSTGLTPPQIIAFDKNLKQTQEALEASIEEKRVLSAQLQKTEVELAKLKDRDYHVPLPPKLHAKILAVDPKWDFVILDAGEDQGVMKDGEMLVNRDGKLVAKIVISSVQKNRCVANVLSGTWRIGEVIEGDVAIPEYPGT